MNLRIPLTSLGAWMFSMVVHASGLCVAILLAADFSVVPRLAPFRWDVTLVTASRPELLTSDQPVHAMASSAAVGPTPGEAVSDPPPSAAHRVPAVSHPVIEQTGPVADAHVLPVNHDTRATEAATPAEHSSDAPIPVTEPLLDQPSRAPASLAHMPPPEVEAPDQSHETMAPSQMEAPRVMTRPAPQFRPTPISRQLQPDYGWLASLVAAEVEQVKRYPAQAKWHRWQGKVVVQAVVHEDGRISDIQVVDSSGHDTLDHDAVALLARISPMQLQYPLDQSFIVVRIPIGYRLE